LADQGINQTVNRTETRIGSLSENTLFYTKVRSINMGGPGPWSPAIAFSTMVDLSPQNLSVSHITPTECLVTWNRLPGTAVTTYELRFAPDKESWRAISNYPAQTFGLEKLLPDTAYRIQVRAKNPTGFGPWTDEAAFHTPPLPPLYAPKDLRAEEVTDISAKISWKPLEKVSGYRLSIGTDTDAGNRGVEVLTQTEFSLKGLIPEKSYFIKINAFNQTGDGPWSEIVLFSTRPTPPLSAPEGVAVLDVLPTSFILVWKPAQDAFSYEIGFGTGPRIDTAELKSVSTVSYTFAALQPETRYYIRVRKVNCGGSGPWSQMKSITTQAP
jgi:hypothetical protein